MMRKLGICLFVSFVVLSLTLVPVGAAKGGNKGGGSGGGGESPTFDNTAPFNLRDGLNLIVKEHVTQADGKLRLFNAGEVNQGTLGQDWMQEGVPGRDIVLADVDGDGTPEIAVGIGCIKTVGTEEAIWSYINVYDEGPRNQEEVANPYGLYASSWYPYEDSLQGGTNIVTGQMSRWPMLHVGDFVGTPGDELVLVTWEKVAIFDFVEGSAGEGINGNRLTKVKEWLVSTGGETVPDVPYDWHDGFVKQSTVGNIDDDGEAEIILAVNRWYPNGKGEDIATSLLVIDQKSSGWVTESAEVYGEGLDSDFPLSGEMQVGSYKGLPAVFARVTLNPYSTSLVEYQLLIWLPSTNAMHFVPYEAYPRVTEGWALIDLDSDGTSEIVQALKEETLERVKGRTVVTGEASRVRILKFVEDSSGTISLAQEGAAVLGDSTVPTGGSPIVRIADVDPLTGNLEPHIILGNWGGSLVRVLDGTLNETGVVIDLPDGAQSMMDLEVYWKAPPAQ